MNEALFEGRIVAAPTPFRTPAVERGLEVEVDVERWAGWESWVEVRPTRCRVRVLDGLVDEVEDDLVAGLRVVVSGHRSTPCSFAAEQEPVVRARAITLPLGADGPGRGAAQAQR